MSQFALGAAVSVAAMGRRPGSVAPLLWGGLCATLPDLDVLIEHGDPVRNMTGHRGPSHALFWLTLAAPLLGLLIAAVHRELDRWRQWVFAVWLALFTHPLLDALTIYGTRLWLPFAGDPVAIGSLFVVDPLFTLPLLVGLVAVLRGRGSARARRWNAAGLLLAAAYAVWSLLAWQHVLGVARRSLALAGIAAERVIATPAPFQTVLWRVVATTEDHVFEGYRSLVDGGATMAFEHFDRGRELGAALAGDPAVERLRWFTGGAIGFARRGDLVVVRDLRMGAEPNYVFAFAVGRLDAAGRVTPISPPVQEPVRFDVARGLGWLMRRALGAPEPPPR